MVDRQSSIDSIEIDIIYTSDRVYKDSIDNKDGAPESVDLSQHHR